MKKNYYYLFTRGNALIIMSLVLLIATVCKLGKDSKNTEKNKSEQIALIDAQIRQAFDSIDSLRTLVSDKTMDSLAHHPEYSYLMDNRAKIDSLRQTNKELLDRAYMAAKKISMFTVARRDERLFTDFKDVSGVNRVKWPYYANKKKIQDYDKQCDAIKHLPAMVRAHFDSTTAKQIYDLQTQIDSLLIKKDSIISQKTR